MNIFGHIYAMFAVLLPFLPPARPAYDSDITISRNFMGRATAEQGYLIRRKSDGYPMVVPIATAVKASGTGDYHIEGKYAGHENSAGFLVNDNAGGELWVPPGFVVVDGSRYEDDRLTP